MKNILIIACLFASVICRGENEWKTTLGQLVESLASIETIAFEFDEEVIDQSGQMLGYSSGNIRMDLKSGHFVSMRTVYEISDEKRGRELYRQLVAWNGERNITWRRVPFLVDGELDYATPGNVLLSGEFVSGSEDLLMLGLLNNPIFDYPLFLDKAKKWLTETNPSLENDTIFAQQGMARLSFDPNKSSIGVNYMDDTKEEERPIYRIRGKLPKHVDGLFYPTIVEAISFDLPTGKPAASYRFIIEKDSIKINESLDLDVVLPVGTNVTDEIRGERYVVEPYGNDVEGQGIEGILNHIVDKAKGN